MKKTSKKRRSNCRSLRFDSLFLLPLVFGALANDARAQESAPSVSETVQIGFILELSGSAIVAPAYEGAIDYEVSTYPTVSGLLQFSPTGRFKSAGAQATARYEFDSIWAAQGAVEWSHLVGDANASPVTALEADNQFAGKLGLTRKYSVGP